MVFPVGEDHFYLFHTSYTTTMGIKKIVAFCLLLLLSCTYQARRQAPAYAFIEPDYHSVSIEASADTLMFTLTEDTYTAIKSFNVFKNGNEEYISFFDQRSTSINIYALASQKLVKRLALKNYLTGKRIYKTSVYTKSFDSILVSNNEHLYVIDINGNIKNQAAFEQQPFLARAVFENTGQPVFQGNKLFAGVRCDLDGASRKKVRERKLLSLFDLQTNEASLHYHFSNIYEKNIYGYHFLDYSYCFNAEGKFVFSFPADPLVYETDLGEHHIAYYAKSQLSDTITPVAAELLDESEESYKSYLVRDSYGAIFFDPYRNRYLRVAKSRITERDEQLKNWKKAQRLIVLDKTFKVIGESALNENIAAGTIFFTNDGSMYARTMLSNEYALMFVKLHYRDQHEPTKLTKK